MTAAPALPVGADVAGPFDAAWDLLTAQEPLLRFLVAGFALILAVIAALAYRRTGHPRIKYVGLAYGVFVVNGLLLVWGLFDATVEAGLLFVTTLLELLILLFLYMAVLKRMG